jgi:hypothetical protein
MKILFGDVNVKVGKENIFRPAMSFLLLEDGSSCLLLSF